VLSYKFARELFAHVAAQYYPKYVVNDENESVIKALLLYCCNDPLFEQSGRIANASLKKGIYLCGNVGSGKTTLMDILNKCNFPYPERRFGILQCRRVAASYLEHGPKGIEAHTIKAVEIRNDETKLKHVCYDDLGAERQVVYFGNHINVMEEVLQDRYAHFSKHGLLSHFTSNLTMDEVETMYSLRCASRLREMCNIVVLGGGPDSTDWRN